jgi:integrase
MCVRAINENGRHWRSLFTRRERDPLSAAGASGAAAGDVERTPQGIESSRVAASAPSPRQTVTLPAIFVTVDVMEWGQIVENLQAQGELPTPQNVTVRSPRPRDYLTEREVEKLMDAARENRYGHRDATAILLAYRHGLRASELVALRWDDIDLQAGKLHVRRSKGGETSVHPIGARELRALRRLQRETQRSVHVFVSERLAPLGVSGYRGWWHAPGRPRNSRSSFPATCCGIAAGTSWRTMARIRGRSNTIWATAR